MHNHRLIIIAGLSTLLLVAGCTDGQTDQSSDARDTVSADTRPADVPTPDDTSDASPNPDLGDIDEDTSDDTTAGCSNNTQIGWTAQLSTKAHEVDGTAVIRDADTIAIDNFSFDGQGPAVFAYVASCDDADSGDWGRGVQIGDQLDQPYDGETVTFPIPDSMDVSDIGGISIWCVDFAVDFGSGIFRSP